MSKVRRAKHAGSWYSSNGMWYDLWIAKTDNDRSWIRSSE